MPNVRWVLPDSYLNFREKEYGGEPFIDGQAVPYDPKYHQEWTKNRGPHDQSTKLGKVEVENMLDGCDFKHWLIVVEKPEGELSRDEIIDSYIKLVASVYGSEQEARKIIYSVSTKHYYAVGVLVSEELSVKFKQLPNVLCVFPDTYLNPKDKDYGGEPFINGQAVPYDPKYHQAEFW
ncbi:Multiple organellar RNA editing factor 8 [Ranunculus cassubicifolius]